MPVNKVAGLLKEYPQRIWTIFNYWISIAYRADGQSSVEQLGIDETSVRKGHSYVTVAADIEERHVIHVTPGKDSDAIGRLKDHLTDKGCDVKQIEAACIDMSTGYIAGMQEHFPHTSIVFDRFHVVKLLNEAMDKVRKAELKEHRMLKGHRYLFLKNNKPDQTAKARQGKPDRIVAHHWQGLPAEGVVRRLLGIWGQGRRGGLPGVLVRPCRGIIHTANAKVCEHRQITLERIDQFY